MNAEQNTVPESSDHFPPEAVAVELAVRFIEDDPCFANAGDVKVQLAALLETALLTPVQRNRLAAVVLRALRHGAAPVFRGYARLAPAVTSPLFEAALTCYAASCQYPVAERAKCVLDILSARRETSGDAGDVCGRSDRSTGRHVCGAFG